MQSSQDVRSAGSSDDGSGSPLGNLLAATIHAYEREQQDGPLHSGTTRSARQHHVPAPALDDTQQTEYQVPTETLTIAEAAQRFDAWKTNVWDRDVNDTRASFEMLPWMPSTAGRKRKAELMAEEYSLEGSLALFSEGDMDTISQISRREGEQQRKRPRLDLNQSHNSPNPATARVIQHNQQASQVQHAEEYRDVQVVKRTDRHQAPAKDLRRPIQQPVQFGQMPHAMTASMQPRHNIRGQNPLHSQHTQQQSAKYYNLQPLPQAQQHTQVPQRTMQKQQERQTWASSDVARTQQPRNQELLRPQGGYHGPRPQPGPPGETFPSAAFPQKQAGYNVAGQSPDTHQGGQTWRSPLLAPAATKQQLAAWGRLQKTAATAAQLPTPSQQHQQEQGQYTYLTQQAPFLPLPPINVERRPKPRHRRNHPVSGDLVEPTAGGDFNEIYRALYPTLAVLLQTKAQHTVQGADTWIRLNLRYREAWSDIKAEIVKAQSALKPADTSPVAQQHIPKRGVMDDGWVDYVEDWDMPYRGLKTAEERTRWLEYYWNSPEREQEKEVMAPIIVSAAFAASAKAQPFQKGSEWQLGPLVEVKWNGSQVVVVGMETK